MMINGFPRRPGRICLKSTGLPIEMNIIIAITSMGILKTNSITSANEKSNNRLIIIIVVFCIEMQITG
jgi:hypothetical protein